MTYMPSDLTSFMEDDSDNSVGVPVPQDSDLATIAQLAHEQLRLQAEVDDAEEALKYLKEQLRAVERGKLPEALAKFGLSSFRLTDGGEISVKDEVYAGIAETKRAEAFKWLEETGNDDIIKNELSLNFGKGQDAETEALVKVLNERGYSFERRRLVHPQTLKAFVRRRLEEGEPVPFETFSVHVDKVAKIRLKK